MISRSDIKREVPILEAQTFQNKDKAVIEEKDMDKYDGITVNNFPLNIPDEEILSFLLEKGLPPEVDRNSMDFVRSDRNTRVQVDGSLQPHAVQLLMKNIHYHECQSKFWNVPIYCKPMRTLTPIKVSSELKKLKTMTLKI